MLSKSPNLEYLRSFHMVAECGSISQAVTKNNITRPTLSRHIQLLEDELGLALFRRTKKGLELTVKGGKVFTYSKSIFQIATDMFDDVLETKSLLSGPVKVVASSGITSIILSKIFNKIYIKWKEVKNSMFTNILYYNMFSYFFIIKKYNGFG